MLSIKANADSATVRRPPVTCYGGWVYKQQVSDGKLIDGYGFGVNLPYLRERYPGDRRSRPIGWRVWE